MDKFEKQQRKQEAWRRLRAQRRRAGQLRGRVIAVSLLSFVFLWAVVFVQMETGNDPVLGDSSATAAVTRPGAARQSGKAKALPAETETSTDSGLAAEELEAQGLEAEALEAQAFEEEARAAEEAEFAEAEAFEAEPEPLTTSQS